MDKFLREKRFFQVSKGKKFQPRLCCLVQILIEYKSQTKIFSFMQYVKIFASHLPFLGKVLEGMILEGETKDRESEAWSSGGR